MFFFAWMPAGNHKNLVRFGHNIFFCINRLNWKKLTLSITLSIYIAKLSCGCFSIAKLKQPLVTPESTRELPTYLSWESNMLPVLKPWSTRSSQHTDPSGQQACTLPKQPHAMQSVWFLYRPMFNIHCTPAPVFTKLCEIKKLWKIVVFFSCFLQFPFKPARLLKASVSVRPDTVSILSTSLSSMAWPLATDQALLLPPCLYSPNLSELMYGGAASAFLLPWEAQFQAIHIIFFFVIVDEDTISVIDYWKQMPG